MSENQKYVFTTVAVVVVAISMTLALVPANAAFASCSGNPHDSGDNSGNPHDFQSGSNGNPHSGGFHQSCNGQGTDQNDNNPDN